jgi:hypothetical protein
VPKARRRDEVARLEAELEAARPFLPLAKEISDDVARLAADGGASPDLLEDAIAAVPQRERLEVARAVFDRLSADQQWAVIERAFGDEEIRHVLAGRRADMLDQARRAGHHADLARHARAEHRFDTTVAPVGERLALGLFREAEVGAALTRGHRSAGCARRVALQAVEAGRFRVIEDVFDPGGSFFVTGDYDRATWTADRLPGHALVRVGSIVPDEGGPDFEPVLYPAGRVDIETADGLIEGRLHLGYVVLGGKDVFSDE